MHKAPTIIIQYIQLSHTIPIIHINKITNQQKRQKPSPNESIQAPPIAIITISNITFNNIHRELQCQSMVNVTSPTELTPKPSPNYCLHESLCLHCARIEFRSNNMARIISSYKTKPKKKSLQFFRTISKSTASAIITPSSPL